MQKQKAREASHLPERANRLVRRSTVVRVKTLLAAFLIWGQTASADTVHVAVAANFTPTFEIIAAAFESQTGHRARIISGSTGQLYAQISRSAPIDVFLAADAIRPQLLVDNGLADAASRSTYARGRLVLWSAVIEDLDSRGLDALDGDFRHIAIANPELAPYGRAARQVLESLEVWDSVRSRIVYGQSIGQTFAMVATQTAEVGLVALSQALNFDGTGTFVIIPDHLHDPIVQDAVLLNSAVAKPAASELLAFLRSSAAVRIIRAHGYDLDP